MSGFRIDLHHTFTPSPPDPRLDQVLSLLQQLRQDIHIMSGSLDTAIAALTAQVTAQTTVDASALTLIQGIPAMIAAAIAQAQSAGATPAQLAAITALGASLDAASQPLAAAVTAGTPAATP